MRPSCLVVAVIPQHTKQGGACSQATNAEGCHLQLKNTIMKELIEILTNEEKSFEGLPKWVYMFAIPAGLVLMCMIGGTLS